MSKVLVGLLPALFMLAFGPSLVAAAPPGRAPDGEAYTVQAGDWLSKIAEKYYGASVNYPRIIEATNAKSTVDGTFTPIDDANLIVPGQRLWIPPAVDADTVTVAGLFFNAAEIEDLGISTLVPRNWPAVDEADPLLRHSWSDGAHDMMNVLSELNGSCRHIPRFHRLRVQTVTTDDSE